MTLAREQTANSNFKTKQNIFKRSYQTKGFFKKNSFNDFSDRKLYFQNWKQYSFREYFPRKNKP